MASDDVMAPVSTLPRGRVKGRGALTLRVRMATVVASEQRERSHPMHTTELTGVIAEHIAAVNAFDIEPSWRRSRPTPM